uniref:Major facilitator superfamily transporter n=1 Tax=Mycena chlorophos TaxID=658473 RepID=A0ABQ0M4I6_MYCCL|nr:major facilitator superfamily transporter [Mycena chlorophos]
MLEDQPEKSDVVVGPETDAASTKEDTPDDFPHGFKLALLMIALCLSVFLVALALAATQLLYGKFYSFFNIKWVYIAAVVLFEIGSAVCGAAPSSDALIGGRAIAGLGCAGIFSGGMIILAHSVTLEKRPLYTGAVGSMFGIASVAGPLMGGAFTDKVTWRWCFYINLPIGAVTLFVMVVFFHVPESAKRERRKFSSFWQLDPLGTLVFIPAIVSLLLALQWGGSKYAWSNGRIIALFVIFGVLIIAFVSIQIWMKDDATVPPKVFMVRSMWSGSLFLLCVGAGYLIIVFYLPIWFQAIKNVSPVRSGIDNIPLLLSVVVGSIFSGALVTVTGYYTPFMILSTVLMTVGAGLLSTFTTNTSTGHWIGYQICFGLGVGVGLQQPIIAAQNVLPLAQVPLGTSLVMFAQTIGGALFISSAENVFTNKLIAGMEKQVPGVSPLVVINAGATELASVIDKADLPAVLHVYNHALVSAFTVSVAMCGISLVASLAMEWKSIKGKKLEMVAA